MTARDAAKDALGLPLSGASSAAAELYQQALDAYVRYSGEPFPKLRAAVADSPDFTMAHALMAYLSLVGTNARLRQLAGSAIAKAAALPASDREKGHVAALQAYAVGDHRRAGRLLEDVSIAEPRDLLALQGGQLSDFLTGDARMLRDRIARARPAWTPDMPNYHAVLGMHAFGLEETGHYARAEAAGREAVALEPRNGWAQHAVAHVLEMQDRRAEGVEWMRAAPQAWTQESFFAVHNWWHLALFHLGLGEEGEVLALYDAQIRAEPSPLAFDMVDAAALLWRLHLRGIDVGGRWGPLAEAFAAEPRGHSAFEDAHAMMAFVGAGREAEATETLAAMRAAAAGGGEHAEVTRDVGLPVAEALHAFGHGDDAGAIGRLRAVRNIAARFGGSHAQRDVLDLTILAAAERMGDAALARALKAERAAAQPSAA
jgi:hypothetical protein